MNITRRRTLGLLGALPLSAVAQSGAYPNKPIRLVVPGTAGSVLDVMARRHVELLRVALSQPIVIDNKPGANTAIGISNVLASPPDGYTLLMGTTELVRLPLISTNVRYDPLVDFIPLNRFAATSVFLAIPANNPANTLREFIEQAKQSAHPVTYGSTGQGSASHYYGEMLAKATGAKLQNVPYKGEVPMLPDLIGAQLGAGLVSGLQAAAQSRDGKLKVLAVGGLKRRSISLPQVPTFAEAGVPGLDIEGFIGYFVVKGTPAPIVRRLTAELARIGAQAVVQDQTRSAGFEVHSGGSPESFRAMLRECSEAWARAVKSINIKLD